MTFQKFKSDIKIKKANSAEFLLFTIWLMIGYAERIEKVIHENVFDQKKKKPGVKV